MQCTYAGDETVLGPRFSSKIDTFLVLHPEQGQRVRAGESDVVNITGREIPGIQLASGGAVPRHRFRASDKSESAAILTKTECRVVRLKQTFGCIQHKAQTAAWD